jgi:hypothetical protein
MVSRHTGTQRPGQDLSAYFRQLQYRLDDVIVCCGEWHRVVTPVVLGDRFPCAIFFDPPYK